MKVTRFVVLAGLALALAACSKSGETTAQATDPKGAAPTVPPVLTVNGVPISAEFFDFYVKNAAGKRAAELTPEERNRALDSLARIYTLAQRADKDGLTKETETASRLELSRLSVIQQAAAQAYLKDKVPTEQEVRAEYETQIAQTAAQEYRARHVLVQSEALAQRVIAQLGKGGDFARLAREFSIDNGSKQNGGDLGWFSPNSMVPQFSAAVVALKKGEFTKQPVQTQYGYHVIRLEDVRDSQPPSFDQAKEQVAQIVQRKKLQAYLDTLLKEAKIEPPLATTPAADAAPAAAAPAAPAQPAQ
jgi:peptidyl-prolyl cis-trans isomerase C